MFKSIKSNSAVVPTGSKLIKVLYNDGKCYKCNGGNLLAITNDGGSISKCLDCSMDVVLFDYISVEEYKKITSFESGPKKDTFNNFITKTKEVLTSYF